ncbi:hypothetical protein [Fibrella musci]|uniref:hypothetical protein n=1 Tax=Fibrella musci TaxID=3242485 RepID=UPI003521B64E
MENILRAGRDNLRDVSPTTPWQWVLSTLVGQLFCRRNQYRLPVVFAAAHSPAHGGEYNKTQLNR